MRPHNVCFLSVSALPISDQRRTSLCKCLMRLFCLELSGDSRRHGHAVEHHGEATYQGRSSDLSFLLSRKGQLCDQTLPSDTSSRVCFLHHVVLHLQFVPSLLSVQCSIHVSFILFLSVCTFSSSSARVRTVCSFSFTINLVVVFLHASAMFGLNRTQFMFYFVSFDYQLPVIVRSS